MKSYLMLPALVLSTAGLALAQSSNTPQGTETVRHHESTIVRPETKPVKVNRSTVKAAQTQLSKRGYDPGPADGIAGPQTQAALRKFQADQGVEQTGRLDPTTMAKLNVGGTNLVSSAPSDLGRGGKALGHNVKEGHPVEGGKAMAQGTESFGKKVGKGAKSMAVGGAEKVGHGLSSVGNKIENKTEGNSNKENRHPTEQQQQTQEQTQQQNPQ